VEGETGSGGTELRVLQDGQLERVVTGDPTFAHASWAGGDAIVYDSEVTPGRRVFRRADYHDTAADPLAPNAVAGSADAAVSADGTRAAFAASMPLDGRSAGLSIVPVDGGDAVVITPPGSDHGLVPFDDYPSFSPDGARIVYLHVVETDQEGDPVTGGLFVVDVDGGTPRRLSADVGSPGRPRFSPDGRQILFDRREAGKGGSSLWVVSVGGGEPSELFDVPSNASAFNADWSPDGSQVVFEYFEDGWDHNELRVVNIDGSDVRTIWRGPRGTSAELPDWGN